VQEEIADCEQQESRIGKVRKVQHVDDQVPELPESGVPDELRLSDRGHRVSVDIGAA